jgi:hypothetical protein
MFTLPKAEIDAMTEHAVRALVLAGVFDGVTIVTQDDLRVAVQTKLGRALSEFTDGPFAIS